MKRIILLLLSFLTTINAQILLDGATAYTQNFNTSTATVPTGWAFSESGSNANSAFSSGTGSGTTGDTYFFGAVAASEWAFGGLQSGNLIPTIGAQFKNNTGAVITQLPISYKGETWRVGTASRSDRLDFQYSTDAASLTTGSWTDYDALDYVNPGQAAGNGTLQHSVTISSTITGLNIANEATFWIRWNSFDASGADDGIAVDDFEIGLPLPVELTSFTSTVAGKKITLNWVTATEVDNYGFDVEKSTDNKTFTKIGFVAGAGNSNSDKYYSFTDEVNALGKYYYRLKQVDTDGSFEYSPVLTVQQGSTPTKFALNQNYPNPFNPSTKISFALATDSDVKLTVFNVLGQEVATLVNGSLTAGTHSVDFNAAGLNSGLYFYKLQAGSFTATKKMMLTK